MARHDDEDQWGDDPLVRALRAPGTRAELADEHEFVAAFRDSRAGSGSVRRLVGRFGIGATTAVTVIALTGGVAAAAYTQTLPDPVQRFAHGVLGPVGVPAPHPADRTTAPRISAGTPSATPSRPVASTTTASGPGKARPTSTPTVGATSPVLPVVPPMLPSAPSDPPPPSDPPTTGPGQPQTRPQTRPVPAAITANVSNDRVVIGSVVTVSGVVTAADGRLLRNRVIRLAGRTAMQPWSQLGTARTDRRGRVTMESPVVSQTTALRLRTGHQVRSQTLRVVVLPVVQVSLTEQAGASTAVVDVQGGRAGDTVTVYRRQHGKYVTVTSVQLDEEARASFSVATPKRPVRFVVRVAASRHHGQAQASAVLGVKA